ncbi:hypothetical protein Dcar01_01849 [Deinococcus carri]|uniref:Uncharacterized protein n=1 Tax=Deinococcus carri TaxID=1211323 RepID=A0ABP9W9B3_9DEIO
MTVKNIPPEPTIAVQCLAVEPASPELRVLAEVNEDGYRQRIVGRASDLPTTLA